MRVLLSALALLFFTGVGYAAKPPVKNVAPSNLVPCNLGVVTYDWDFSVSPQGFTLTDCDQGGGPAWEWGPTTYIPGAPARVWATLLNANYRNDSGLGLVSPSWVVDAQSRLVEVYHYYDIETTYDGCNVSVGRWPNSQVIQPLGSYPVQQISPSPDFYAYCVDLEPGWTGLSNGWRVDCFDLSQYVGSTVNLEFDFGSDATVTKPGWYIGAVRVGGAAEPLAACCDTLTGVCTVVTQNQCIESGGVWHPELNGCDPNPCPQPPGPPCANCGPGPHWIDQCTAGVDQVADQAAKVGIDTDLDPDCVADISLVMRPCPAPDDRVTIQRSAPLDDSAQFPGLRPLDGHLDVIDTEIISMCLTAGGVTLRAGAGQGQGANLQPTLGAIAEQAGDNLMADSFFDVFFEVDLGGGQYLYNQTPLRISGDIDCVPPQVGYIHLVDCIPLFTAPVGGQHVGNLTSAEHVVNPGQDPAVCCTVDGCQILTMDECFAQDGLFHPEWNSCVPDPCPLPPGPPCANCGPGNHWVDQCSAGMDYVADQAAKVGIDTDLDPDCVADISLVMRPCPAPDDRVAIRRSAPLDDSAQFPGLRPVDGHLDVIDTEIVSMCVTAGGITLRAGAGQGQGANLQPSFGAIAEQAGDDTMAESFFDVFFEVDLGGGQYLYNQTPLRISGDIDCVPPQVGYIHLVDCIPLFTAPVGGQHVGNLTSAEHVVNPGQDPAVCCTVDGCQILTMDDCFAQDGLFHPEWNSCVPDPCPLPPGPPCANCGPGDHWIDQCSAGLDYVADQAAKVGIDTDLDPNCVADISRVMRPCPAPDDRVTILRSAPLDDSAQFPGLRPVDGHLDVIDTEIVSMCLKAGSLVLRAGAGQGQGTGLPPTLGAIAELGGDPSLAESFFDVFFEVDLGGGVYLYNHEPLRITGEIDCVPPQVGYIHIVDCLPLYTDPVGGQHVGNLTSAEHVVNPGQDPAVCCVDGDCQIVTMDDCFAVDGEFHPEWNSCVPNPCPSTGVLDDSGQPVGKTALFSAKPNPFTGTTSLSYYLAQPGQLDIEIYDAGGRHVRRLLSTTAEAGVGSVDWDGRNDAGDRVGSGVYFARLRAGVNVQSQRMLILR